MFHPVSEYELLPSRRVYRASSCETNHYKLSLVSSVGKEFVLLCVHYICMLRSRGGCGEQTKLGRKQILFDIFDPFNRHFHLKKRESEQQIHFFLGWIDHPLHQWATSEEFGKAFWCISERLNHHLEVHQELDSWVTKVEKSDLPGRRKAWIYQHSILPHYLWLLLWNTSRNIIWINIVHEIE